MATNSTGIRNGETHSQPKYVQAHRLSKRIISVEDMTPSIGRLLDSVY